ncbi:hypothetical protein ASC89_18345 [Devosia sp. Root413D1]|uniref:hypothetical protein n=1 Tax=Devosia sp. Root413D1 TaxID=1736531 RepID=UPI0006F47DE9|nr:hypothetical protein [Devosia sp. Root413D1]KQW77162.1 hypothetical protein ASC89_18345 [Devosia sp. Root413D1]
MHTLQLLAGAATALASLTLPALAADYDYRTNANGDLVLRLSGPITPVDGGIFLAEVNRKQPRIVELSGPGGDLLSAVRIGVIIHERYMWTRAVGECRSACAYIWIAGLHMQADEGVKILNHLPVARHGAGQGIPDTEGTALFGWYLGRLELSVEMMEAFLDKATAAGTVANQYFDMLAFAEYWNAPVEIVPAEPESVRAALTE